MKSTPYKESATADMPHLGIDGEVVSMALTKHCLHVKEADSGKPIHSVGVGYHSLAFTDNRTLLVIGEPDEEYAVTDLRAAKLEAEEAVIYDRPFDASRVVIGTRTPENSPPEGEFPNVKNLMARVAALTHWVEVTPESVRNALQIAVKAGADRMMLGFDEDENINIVGFKFVGSPSNPSPDVASAHQYQGCVVARLEKPEPKGPGRPKKKDPQTDNGQMALDIPEGEEPEDNTIDLSQQLADSTGNAITMVNDETETVPYAEGEGCAVEQVSVNDPKVNEPPKRTGVPRYRKAK